MQADELADRYFDLKMLAQYSCIGVRTLRSYLRDPDHPLPHFRLRGKVLVRRRDFDLWIEGFRAEAERTSLNKLVNNVLTEIRTNKASLDAKRVQDG